METCPFVVLLSKCRHAHCIKCIRRWCFYGAEVQPMEQGDPRITVPEPTCPMCKERFSFTPQRLQPGVDTVQFAILQVDEALRKTQSLPCPKCERKVPVIRLFAHVLDCVPVPCPACTQDFIDWDSHLRQQCPKVPVACCGARGTFAQMQEHKRVNACA